MKAIKEKIRLTENILKTVGDLTPEKTRQVLETLKAKVAFEKFRKEQCKPDPD